MESKRTDILERAFFKIREIYKEEGIEPGILQKIGIKPQWNVIIGSNGQSGLALNFTGEHSVYEYAGDMDQFKDFQKNIGTNLFDFAESLLYSDDMQQRSLCLAAMNALCNPLTSMDRLKRKGFKVSGEEMDDFVKPTDKVTIIGHGGIVRAFFGKCKELHVSDMRPVSTFQTLVIGDRIEYGPQNIYLHTADENEQIVSQSDIVIITACTLVNNTFGEIVNYAKKARVIGLYGPSAQITPEVLFETGINFIRSFRVADSERFEYDMINDLDMEVALKGNQNMYHVYAF